ncbi:MAG: hypothetical protein EAZ30_17325 [Betaproteobacteria bacterium]|nr:MAG: hypothetical protein EAZ30_17325 [Betaproteobacteria bacterium]
METENNDSSHPLDARWDLLWGVQLSTLYHLKRERFLDGADRAAKAVSALGGAAAFSQIKSDPALGLWLTAIITIVATLSLVYGPATKARKHSELARDFKRLEADIAVACHDLSVEEAAKFQAKYLSIESGEPASLGALVTQCHNELAVARDKAAAVTPLPILQRLFKNWFDFDQSLTSGNTISKTI